MRTLIHFVFVVLFVIAADSTIHALNCIAGAKAACEKVHAQYEEREP